MYIPVLWASDASKRTNMQAVGFPDMLGLYLDVNHLENPFSSSSSLGVGEKRENGGIFVFRKAVSIYTGLFSSSPHLGLVRNASLCACI